MKYPVPMKRFSGTLNRKNASLEEALEDLTLLKSQYSPVEHEYLEIIGPKKSTYHKHFHKGADIYPRRFWFVKPVKHNLLGFNQNTPFVASDVSVQTKKPWDQKFSGIIESIFFFATLLGQDVLPFGNLPWRLFILPGKKLINQIRLYNSYKEAEREGYTGLAEYLFKVESYWAAQATQKARKFSIYQWLNWRNKLTSQSLSESKFKVLYVTSATYMASCVIDQSGPFSISFNKIEIPLKGFVAECKTYWFETSKIEEAYYLSAILNSQIVDQLIKPLQSRGLWGPRDIHKRPLVLPIPQFNKSNNNHKRLARLSAICHKKVNDRQSEILNTAKSTGLRRSFVRELLKEHLAEIDEITKTLLFRARKDLKSFFK